MPAPWLLFLCCLLRHALSPHSSPEAVCFSLKAKWLCSIALSMSSDGMRQIVTAERLYYPFHDPDSERKLLDHP